MFGSKPCGQAKNIIPRGRWDQNLDLHKICGPARAKVFFDTLAD
jgi:hypothetical protein